MRNDLKRAMSTVLVPLGLVVGVSTVVWGSTAKQSQTGSQIWVPGQERIQKEVLHELRMLPYYSVFDNLSFRVEGNRVVLMGQVVRPTLKSDAEGVVKRIEGVERVVNNIEVLPLSSFDDRIRLAEYRTIYGYPGLGDRYGHRADPSIHIIVKNGNVALVGVVGNEMDKNIAGIRANEVAGVFSVSNNLQVAR